MKMNLTFFFFVITFAFFFNGSCSRTAITNRQQVMVMRPSSLFPESFEAYRTLISESPVSQDLKFNTEVLKVAENLTAATNSYFKAIGKPNELNGYDWEVNIIDAPGTVNASCLPGGKIVIYTGIAQVTANVNGLAAVMGHEIAHALLNHGAERVSQVLLAQVAQVGVEIATENKDAETRDALRAVYNIGAQWGVILPFSRLHESEADKVGLYLMALAGYDVYEAPKVWQRMAALGGEKPPAFLSTHPSDQRRSNDLQKEIPAALAFADQYKTNSGSTPDIAQNNAPINKANPGFAAGFQSGNNKTETSNAATLTNKGTTSIPSAVLDFKYKGKGTTEYDPDEFETTAPKLKGLCYRVQLEYTSMLPDVNKYQSFKEIGTIYIEKIVDRPIYRIIAGEFKTLELAKSARDKAKKIGAKNPIAIEFIDGNRGRWFQL